MKPIQFVPKRETREKVETLAGKLRTSNAAVVTLAVETILEKIEKGEAAIVNGEVQFTDKQAA